MKFGKVEDISGIDLSLPQDMPGNSDRIAHTPVEHGERKFYLGGTAWSNRKWIGEIYPRDTKIKNLLPAYGKQFNTIEFNSTHYRIPSANTVVKWRDNVPDDFKFCPKMLQRISHSRGLGMDSELPAQFINALSLFEKKLGPCFIQLPPYFGNDRLGILKKFINHYYQLVNLAIELRHNTWFQQQELFEEYLNYLSRFNVHTVITDVAGRRDVLHMGVSSRTVLIRFVGNQGVDSDYSRIDEWVDRIADWWKFGMEDVYFFLHHDPPSEFTNLAQYLLNKIEKLPLNIIFRGPNPVQEGQGVLF